MTLGNKGKKVLKNVNYDVFRQAFIKSIMKNIRQSGMSGQNIQDIIKQTLDDKRFKLLVKDTLQNIAKETDMNPRECKQALPLLIEEDVAKDLDDNLEGEVHSQKKTDKTIYEKGEEQGLWYNLGFKRILGEKPKFFPDLVNLIKTQNVIRYSLLLGSLFLCISTIFFQSAYKTILVGLTLTAFEGDLYVKIGNVFAGFGGVLLFFISLAITVQFLMNVKKRDDQIKKIADEYLQRTKKILKDTQK